MGPNNGEVEMKTKTQKNETTTNDRYMTEWITAEEAAAYLRMSRRSLYQHLRNGKLGCHRFGRKIRFRRFELDELFEKSSIADIMRTTGNGGGSGNGGSSAIDAFLREASDGRF